jgi:hypothetical protein
MFPLHKDDSAPGVTGNADIASIRLEVITMSKNESIHSMLGISGERANKIIEMATEYVRSTPTAGHALKAICEKETALPLNELVLLSACIGFTYGAMK